MSQKHSTAIKNFWAKMTSEEKSIELRRRAKKRWAKISPEDRLKQATLMVKARLAKKKK